MSNTCQWCRKRPATQEDNEAAEYGGKEDHVCWRAWNDYSECHEIERRLCEIAPLMRDAIIAWEEWENHCWQYSNANVEDKMDLDVLLEVKAIDLRDKAIAETKDIL